MGADGITFKCGACGQLMAAAVELQGRPVRCPHCQQVVQAPSSAPATPFDAMVPAAEAADGLPGSFTGLAHELSKGPGDSSPWRHLTDPASSATLTRPETGLTPAVADAPVLPEMPPWLAPTLTEMPALTPKQPPQPGPWQEDPTLGMTPPPTAPNEVVVKPSARPKAKIPISFWLMAFLLPMVILLVPAIGMLAYLKVLERGQDKPIHPLESLQDDGIYKDLQEGKRQEVINPLEELPKDRPPLRLGLTVQVGGLEVTPLEVVRQKLPYAYYRGTTGYVSSDEVLVLRLRLKNVTDILFHPHDPTFNRAFRQGVQPYSFLMINDKRFYGTVLDPTTERIRGQHFGELFPGEEVETIFVAGQDPAGTTALQELKKVPPNQPLIWRVQLRKGREAIRGRQVWVTTVLPIEFKPSDVREAKRDSGSPTSDR